MCWLDGQYFISGTITIFLVLAIIRTQRRDINFFERIQINSKSLLLEDNHLFFPMKTKEILFPLSFNKIKQIISVILHKKDVRFRIHISIFKLAQLVILIQETKIIKWFEYSQIFLTTFTIFNSILKVFVVYILAKCFVS